MLKSSKIGNNKRGKKMYRGGNNEKKEASHYFQTQPSIIEIS